MLRSLLLFAASSKLPFILVSSPPLRETSTLFERQSGALPSPLQVERQLRTPVPFVSHHRRDGARSAHAHRKEVKEMKKRGFNAIIRWCAYHQETNTMTNLELGEQLKEEAGRMDAAVVQWVNDSVDTFSGGQCLVVLTFLCDVLHRQAKQLNQDENTAGATTSSRDLVDPLAHLVALLTTRSVTGEQLELQPFFILLSSLYGLTRVTEGNPLQLPTLVLESLKPPAALWVALLRQTRAFYAAVQSSSNTSAIDSGDAAVNAEAILTLLVLFSPEQKKSFFAPSDYKMMSSLTHRLLQYYQPALRASRAHRKQRTSEVCTTTTATNNSGSNDGEAADSCSLDELARDVDGDEPDKGVSRKRMTCVEADEATASNGLTAAGLLLPGRQSVNMAECCRILHNAPASEEQRVHLLEYFLFVAHDPATMTVAELHKVPQLFAAVRSLRECRRAGLADYVVDAAQVTDLTLIASLLPYAQDKWKMKPMVEEALQCLPSSTASAAQLFCSGADEGPLSAAAALSLLYFIGGSLSSNSRLLLLRCCLATAPSVLHAVAAALSAKSLANSNASVPQHDQSTAPPKVLLTPDLCVFLRCLVEYDLSKVPYLLPPSLDPATAAHHTTMLIIAGAVARSIDWARCAPEQMQLPQQSHLGKTPPLPASPAIIASGVLAAYLRFRYVFHFLSAEEEMEDRVLLNSLVVPLFRSSGAVFPKSMSTLVLSVLPHLKSEEYQRQLLDRVLRLAPWRNYRGVLDFVRDYAELATKLRVFPDVTMKNLFTNRVLMPRNLPAAVSVDTNLSKMYTIVLVRVVRYVIASDVLTTGKSSDATQRREAVTLWFDHYFYFLSAALRKADAARGVAAATAATQTADGVSSEAAASAANVEADVADDHHHEEVNDEAALSTEMPSAESGKSRAATEAEAEASDHADAEDAEDDDAEDREEASAAPRDDDLTSDVTEEDVEAVLTLMLQAGIKASSKTLAFVAQRLRDKVLVGGDDIDVVDEPAEPAPEGLVAETDEDVRWGEEPSASRADRGEAVDPFLIPAHRLPLPAHFVCAVRADSVVPLPLSATYLAAMLRSCDLAIFHHVVSAFFTALKRGRVAVVLEHDLEITALTVRVLQERLTAHQQQHAEETPSEAKRTDALRSTVAFKSLVHILFHFSQLPSSVKEVQTLVQAVHTTPAGEVRNARPAWKAEAGDCNDGDDGASTEESPPSRKGLAKLLHTHAVAASCVLPVAAFITATQLKEFSLAHLQRLAFFFPEAASFVFLQVRPQLPSFAQRELLQLASQYPAGAAEVLAELGKLDLHVSVDLGEFVPMAKRLPMLVNEAIVMAHVPHLTVAWVTRVLSALAARHEEMPASLLRALLARVEEVAETATESDKSLLLLILQGYLLFGPRPGVPTARAASSVDDSAASVLRHRSTLEEKADDRTWMEDFFLAHAVMQRNGGAALLTQAERQARVNLIRHCCDQLLSLERITTLEELRYFLVSYPPSLHQLRERGVVEKVEQALLPDMLSASPVRLHDLDVLVSVLHEHRVLLPNTVQRIAEAVFDTAQLELLRQTSLTSAKADSAAVLTACLRIAVVCAEATNGRPQAVATTTTDGTAAAHEMPLTELVDMVLSVFDTTQDWLAAMTSLVTAQGRSAGSGGTATTASAVSAQPQPTSSFSSLQMSVVRHLCAMLLSETDDLNPSEFAQLVQCLSRLKAWDLAMPPAASTMPPRNSLDFSRAFCAMFERADAHSRCVLLRAITADAAVLHRFESLVFRVLLHDVALLSAEDLELVLTATLQASSEEVVEPLLDAVGTRLLSMMEQCRRSTLVRLLQCYSVFAVEDATVVLAALAAIERQSTVEVKLDATQVIIVLQTIARLGIAEQPERLVVLCFQRLEKIVQSLTPMQLYQAGQLILDLEMGYTMAIHNLVTYILESRDGARGHANFHHMAEALCDVFDVEIAPGLRAARLRKRNHKTRIRDYYAAQRKEMLLAEA